MDEINIIDKLSDTISENDKLRSKYIWKVISNSTRINHVAKNHSNIPRILVQFWDDVETIPTDVKKCLNSWKAIDNYGFNRLLFDDESSKKFIINNYDSKYLEAFKLCNHPAMRADYFRLCYLYRNGGFYVDADDVFIGDKLEMFYQDNKLKIQPLCYDSLTNQMVNISNLSILNKHYDEYIYYVNNDPIITPPYHPIIQIALDRSTNYLLDESNTSNDIQSITGPGNLTASIVKYAIKSHFSNNQPAFTFLYDWNKTSISKWPLDYREDKRNWRLWDGSNM
jgi:mannosyltransferase OCH1-like enzyme